MRKAAVPQRKRRISTVQTKVASLKQKCIGRATTKAKQMAKTTMTEETKTLAEHMTRLMVATVSEVDVALVFLPGFDGSGSTAGVSVGGDAGDTSSLAKSSSRSSTSCAALEATSV